METPKLETEVQVMFFDTDAGGVVHNIAYLRFIETNRSLLAEKLGWPLAEMLNLGDCPVVVRTEIDYRKPGKLWDKLLVQGELERFERSRFWCRFAIVRPRDGQLLVTCRQMLVVVRLPELKVQRLPVHWENEFGHLKAQPVEVGEDSPRGKEATKGTNWANRCRATYVRQKWEKTTGAKRT
jgi:YbgC/YbaW family acyl-CoA thioester hydrolase